MNWRWFKGLSGHQPSQGGGNDVRGSANAPSVQRVCERLLTNVNADAPGHGADIHSPDKTHDWPTAYGLLASASFALHLSGAGPSHLRQGLNCASWLASNAGCRTTKAPCWGVPYSRKIWEDAEPAMPGTAFAIPTCHAIQALDEAASLAQESAEVHAFRKAAARAAEYFAENCCDELGDELTIWYSPLRQHSFHVTNAIAMMAGQMQRAARFSTKGDLLADRADRAIRYLLRRKSGGPNGPNWSYFGDRIPCGKSNKKNDLLHEAFVCHGMIEYKAHGGRLAGDIDYDELLRCLGKFNRAGTFFEFPEDEPVKSRTLLPARVMGLGHALYAAARIAEETGRPNGLGTRLADAISSNYVLGDDLFHRPGGDKVSTFVRDVGHVLLGLCEHIRSRERAAASRVASAHRAKR